MRYVGLTLTKNYNYLHGDNLHAHALEINITLANTFRWDQVVEHLQECVFFYENLIEISYFQGHLVNI
jgi:hypothetical protein